MTPKGQLALPMTNGKNVFEVEEDDDVLINTEQVFIGGIKDQEPIIIDTGSSHNLIGRHLLTLLKQRLENAGVSSEPLLARNNFQFGGNTEAMSTCKLIVPLKLSSSQLLV